MRYPTVVAVSAAMLAACAQDHGISEPDPPSFGAGDSQACAASGATVANLPRYYGCNALIQFTFPSSGFTSSDSMAVRAAADTWNQILGGHGAPRLTADPAAVGATVRIPILGGGGSNSNWCGGVPDGAPGVPPSSMTLTNNPTLQCGTIGMVALHEMAHVLGLLNNWHTTAPPNCIVAINSSFAGVTTTGDYCQFEVEAILATYGLRTTAPSLSQNILTGLSGATAPPQLSPGQTAVVSWPTGVYGHVSGTLCGGTARQTCTYSAALPQNTPMVWTSSNPAVATVSGSTASATITAGNTSGTAIISAIARAAPNVATYFGVGEDGGGRVSVTVVALPDLAPGTIVPGGSVAAGNSYGTTIQERNLAPSTAVPAGWTGRIYLSTDQVFSPATDALVGTFSENTSIPGGQTRSVARTATIPAALTAGPYYEIVVLDATGVIAEGTGEGNNNGFSTSTMQVLPPPPLTATINYGPSTARPRTLCEWDAQATGGVPPYTWQWKADSLVLPSTEQAVNYTTGKVSFTLHATATDALGHSNEATFPVTVSSSAPACIL